jgi:hypothetical protein
MTQEALKLALEALEVATTPLAKDRQEVLRAITAIKEALAQTQELWCMKMNGCKTKVRRRGLPKMRSQPPQRTWVDLTDEEENKYNYLGPDMYWVIQEIKAILKEKNT